MSKNKSNEPYLPENTPTPPQVMDPRKKPNKDQNKAGSGTSQKQENKHGGKKLLGESEIEIEDETTI